VETTLVAGSVTVTVTRSITVMALEASAASVCWMVCTTLVVAVTKLVAVTTTWSTGNTVVAVAVLAADSLVEVRKQEHISGSLKPVRRLISRTSRTGLRVQTDS
jgi:hypothetical protein